MAGNDIRIGTNGANETGRFIVRTNSIDRVFVDNSGNLGIADATPTERLDVDGNINIAGNILNIANSSYSPLQPLCYGTVKYSSFYDSTTFSGTPNFTAVSLGGSIQKFKITCPGVTVNSIIKVNSAYEHIRVSGEPNNGFFYVTGMNWSTDDEFDFFRFIVYNP